MAEAKPQQHFHDLVTGLRERVRVTVESARALRARGVRSLSAFEAAHNSLSEVYDVLDDTTAEINGALLAPGDNGGPPLDDIKNSAPPPSPPPPPPPAPPAEGGDPRAVSFSDLHPSARVQTGI